MSITIVELCPANAKDINKSNQEFIQIGELIPEFTNGAWTISEKLYDKPKKKKYAEDNFDKDNYISNPNKALFLAYQEDVCVGQIVIRKNWNNYTYIEDISVGQIYRNKGIGCKLLEKAQSWNDNRGLFGLMLETQNTNLHACRFYVKNGFKLGGVDMMLYRGLNNDEYALFFYR